MKVKCKYDKGQDLMTLLDRVPFGIFKETLFNEIEVGKEYIVMGIILKNGFLSYLVDDSGIISASPSQLFEIIDNTVPTNWHFKSFAEDNPYYKNKEAVWGYYELVFDESHYEKLINCNESAELKYYRRKIELEKTL